MADEGNADVVESFNSLALHSGTGASEPEATATDLVEALQRVKRRGGNKTLVRSTDHLVDSDAGPSSSALVEEEEEGDEEGSTTALHHNGSGSIHREKEAGRRQTVLTSWKTNEFAYRKTTSVGLKEEDELPTLARGLFTTVVADSKPRPTHCIVIRGYDKFFNEGEMPWTKVSASSSTTAYIVRRLTI